MAQGVVRSRRETDHAVSAGAIVAKETVHLCVSPTLILGLGPFPRLGVTGAGIAVLASYGTGAAILLLYLSSRRAAARLQWGAVAPRMVAMRRILAVGGPAALTLLWPATTICATMLVARFGPAPLAGYGAAQRLELLQAPLSFALGSAVVTMVASNLGAGQVTRARAVGRAAALLSGCIGIGFAAIALPWAWMRLFTHDPTVVAAGVAYLRWIGATLALAGVGYGIAFALMGAGRASVPAFESLLRVLVVLVLGVAAGMWGGGLSVLFGVVAGNLLFAFTLWRGRALRAAALR
jgi:Na+-driven multidrug efflux pump